MIYKLSVSKYFYSDQQEVDNLKELGFKFRDFILSKQMELLYKIKNYQPNYKYSIEYYDPEDVKIEINTLEELHKFILKYGRIVMKFDSIEIYNSKRE